MIILVEKIFKKVIDLHLFTQNLKKNCRKSGASDIISMQGGIYLYLSKEM